MAHMIGSVMWCLLGKSPEEVSPGIQGTGWTTSPDPKRRGVLLSMIESLDDHTKTLGTMVGWYILGDAEFLSSTVIVVSQADSEFWIHGLGFFRGRRACGIL